MSALPLTDGLDTAARRALDEIAGLLDAPRRHVAMCAQAFLEIHAGHAPGELRREHLQALVPLLDEILAGLPAGVDGAGVVTAPGALADQPLWLEWWRRGRGGGIERLTVTFDPDHPARFDYPQAEWFVVPRDRGIEWVTGPFVDRGGTNCHLCTYSRPLHGPDGTFLGIAGMDLRVGYVEAHARRALPLLDGIAVLVNQDARIIASHDPALPAGSLLEPDLARCVRGPRGARRELRLRGGAVAWHDTLPWGVALFPAPRAVSARAR
jgi:hypothetical protein